MAENETHHHHYHNHYYQDAGRMDRPSPNRHRLRRSSRHRLIAGVCGGLSEYFGWRVGIVRLVTAVAFVAFMPFVAIAYIAATLIIPRDAEGAHRRESPEEREFWRGVSIKPRVTFGTLKHRFRAIDGRLADMERAVTSEEYRLNKAFRDLEGDAPRGS